MSPVDDRAAILRRRALFLGTTLAALGSCQKSGARAETAHGPVVAVPEGQPEDGGTNGEPDAASLPTRDASRARRGDMPSLEIPTGISEAAQANYEHLVRTMTRAHGLLDEIEGATPKCSISACEDRWLVIAKKLFDLEDTFGFFHGCGGKSEQAMTFAARQKEHLDFYQARRNETDGALKSVLGDAGWARLEELLRDERMANPRPCLSIACIDW